MRERWKKYWRQNKRWLSVYVTLAGLIAAAVLLQAVPAESQRESQSDDKPRQKAPVKQSQAKKSREKDRDAAFDHDDKPKGLLTDTQKQTLQEQAAAAVESCDAIFRDYGISNPDSAVLTKEQQRKLVMQLGSAEVSAYGTKINIQNPEAILSFYQDVQNQKESQALLYQVNIDGSIGVHCFYNKGIRLEKYFLDFAWTSQGYNLRSSEEWEIDEFRVTEKGYLIYHMPDSYLVGHSALRYGIRLKPQPQEYLDLYEKYLSGFGFANNNLLTSNWDQSSVGKLNYSAVFFDLYHKTEGKEYENTTGYIQEDKFENLLIQYLPVTREDLRASEQYNADKQTYKRVKSEGMPFGPEAEVVDYQENTDGTVTLTVDILWIDYDTDLAFTDTLTIQPYEDGGFRYLSNKVEIKEKKPPKS